MATVQVCDKCKGIVEGNPSLEYPAIEVNEDHVKLMITVTSGAELCPTCIKKEQYAVAKKAFALLQTKKQRKAKVVGAKLDGEEGKAGKKKGKTPAP
jgi:hypothetical protein